MMIMTISSGLVNNTGTALATKSSNSILLETFTIAAQHGSWFILAWEVSTSSTNSTQGCLS